MVAVTWTEEAERWLEDIFEYIAAENPSAAGDVVVGIYEQSQILVEFPQIGYEISVSIILARCANTAIWALPNSVLGQKRRQRRYPRSFPWSSRY